MADTGFNWGSLAHVTYSTGSDVDGVAVNDEATLTTDAVDLDDVAACEVSVEAYEDNTGATNGDIHVYLLRSNLDPDSEGWQDINDASEVAVISIDQNTTRRKTFPVDPGEVGSFKLLVDNDCGQQVAVTINYRTATVPAAS